MNHILFSSSSDEWSTPVELFNELNNEFKFSLDPCCSIENKKCNKYYTIEDNGLLKSWKGEKVFCNPPYSKLNEWVEKCYREACNDNTLVCLLIPARTDTKYFHNFIYNRSEIRFIKKRLRFNGSSQNAPFPSMIVIFRGPYCDI